jgi:hypothetical protein
VSHWLPYAVAVTGGTTLTLAGFAHLCICRLGRHRDRVLIVWVAAGLVMTGAQLAELLAVTR